MHSLHRRLSLGLVGVFFLVVAAGAGALYFALRAALLAQFDAGLRVKAMIVVTATEQRRGDLDVDFSDRFLREFDDDLATDFFQVWINEGKSEERSDSLGERDLPRRFGSMEEPKYWNLELPKGRGPGRAIGIKFRPRIDGNDRRTRDDPIDAVVVVAAQRKDLDAMLRRMGIVLSVSGLGMLLGTFLTVPLVLRPGLRPVRRIADHAQAIDANTLGQRFPTAGVPAELRPICERLNDLLARLEASFERERRFSGDLAHELLTPLSELRAIAESALKWPETAGPDDYRRSVDILLRMETLVTRVLELARAEHGQLATQIEQVELVALIRDVGASHEAAASARGLELVLEGPETLEVETDAGVLRVIVGNLVSNAVTYAPAHSVVRISWSAKTAAFEITVANPAPEIQSEDLPHLFERFWRKDPSRTDTQHRGLGLSLASELASVLGGSLAADKSPEGDLVFRLNLPSSPGDHGPHTRRGESKIIGGDPPPAAPTAASSLVAPMEGEAPPPASAPPPSEPAAGPASPPISPPPPAGTLGRAGFGPRLAAALLDLLLVVVASRFLDSLVLFPFIWLAYHVAFWTWRQTTFGGVILSIRIERLDGSPMDFGVALVRALSSVLSLLPLGLGFLWVLWNPDCQSWHDKIAGTTIVRLPRGHSVD